MKLDPKDELTIGQMRELRDQLEAVIQLPGWQYMAKILGYNSDALKAEILTQPVTSEGIYQQEYNKGMVSVYEITRSLPNSLIDVLDENIELEKARIKEKSDDDRE